MNEINYKLLQQVHQLKPIIRTKVVSIGTYLPENRVSSDEIMQEIDTEKLYGMPYDWMSKEMGIIERRMTSGNEEPSELATKAALDAIASKPDLNLDLIDAVIFCGIEKDLQEPATAHIIQNNLGLNADHVFDVSNACFGFIDGLKIASTLIEAEMVNYALVVTGEVSTKVSRRVMDILKKGVSLKKANELWGTLSVGDAGGAVLVGRSENGHSGFMKFNQRSESRHVDLCRYKWTENGDLDIKMKMAGIVSRGFKLNEKIYKETLKELGWEQLDWVVAHQTGNTTFKQTTSLHSIKESKIIKTYPMLGNITTATLPISFKKLFNSGNLINGDKIGGLFAGSGLVAGQFGYVV